MTRSPIFTTFFSRYGFLLGLLASSFGTAMAQPVRGLYVSGAAGASFNQAQTIIGHRTLNNEVNSYNNYRNSLLLSGAPGTSSTLSDPNRRLKDNFSTGITGLGAIGWGLGNGFRVELEGNYRNNNFHSNQPSLFNSHGHQRNYGIMTNALFDMDIGQNWIYPYIGAGIGYGWQNMHYHQNMSSLNGTNGNFAYQAMFGVALPVPWVVGLSTTMEYRFYSLTGHHSGAAGNDTGTRSDFNHSLMLGLRYEFNPEPPPAAHTEKAALTTAPAPTSTRTYLVFFDWNSADMNNKARQIVRNAAQNISSAQVTHIEIDGHTDMSGQGTKKGQAYNQKLSLQRAHAVEHELIRDGVAAGLMTIHALGGSQPLVVTAIGVREAQNRRVEIDIK